MPNGGAVFFGHLKNDKANGYARVHYKDNSLYEG